MLKRLGRILAAVVCVSAMAVWCGAVDFSADTVSKMDKMTMKGKVYRQGKKLRQESNVGGMKRIIIMRPDKKVIYVVDPAAKTYMEMPQRSGLDPSHPFNPKDLKKLGKLKNLGCETINGYVCDKSNFVPKNKKMGSSTQWISRELQWPMKLESKTPRGSMVTETKNVKKGTLSAALFEVPKGYKKQALPQMPQGHGGMRGMPGKPMPGRTMPARPK